MSSQDKQIAAAISRLRRLETQDSFDAAVPGSKATPEQQAILNDLGIIPHRFLKAGNQCLAEGTLVLTTRGLTPIQNIKVGDTVYDEYGQPVRVSATWDNGPKEVADLTIRGVVMGTCTAQHIFQIQDPEGKITERKAQDFLRDDRIRRVSVQAPLGTVTEPHAYIIGALLGDGCSRAAGRKLQISSGTPEVPEKVAAILGTTARRQSLYNYNWQINTTEKPNHYLDWCQGRYAHEKIVDMDIIRTWDRSSLIQFVAGLIDTDGTIYPSRDHLTLSLDMQARSVVDAFEYAILALWQVPLNRSIDNRAKYKNGPVHVAYTRNRHHIQQIMSELDEHIVSPQKKWREEYNTLGGKRSSPDLYAARWGANRRIVNTYDITVDSSTSLYLLANGMVTHNSGKSQLAARETAWILTETHPTWTRPDRWGDEPLLLIVMGRTTKQIEETLWRKISGFLDPSEIHITRQGGALQKVTHLPTKNAIIFLSHHSINEAREKVQSFVAHYVWLDEMPSSYKLIEELHRRIQARGGYFLATFTPKALNQEIRRLVDAASLPLARTYRLSMLDNPIYSQDDKDKIMASMASYSEQYRNTILYGDWMTSEESVYYLDYDTMVRAPQGYDHSWRHVEAVDPALRSALGLTLWAEDPRTSHWYMVRAKYLRGILVPTDLVRTVQEEVRPYNIIRRISDPHEIWYMETAASMGVLPRYQGVYKKTSRKGELIKGLQERLGHRLFIAPWCEDFITEMQDCRWSDQAEARIVNQHAYHLLDSAQYFADNIPAPTAAPANLSPHEHLRRENERRIQMELTKAMSRPSRGSLRVGRARW